MGVTLDTLAVLVKQRVLIHSALELKQAQRERGRGELRSIASSMMC